MTKGYHTTWRIPAEHRADPAYVEAGAAIALGQAVYDRRTELGLTLDDLAQRSGLALPDLERIEGGATAPTMELLRTLAVALDARLDLAIEVDETHVAFVGNGHAA